MPNSILPLLVVIALAVAFGIVTGFNNAANATATVIGTRTLSPRRAVIMATILNFVGAVTGLEVARTIGKSILVPEAISYQVVIAALLSVILWGTFATYLGLPISLTHGFISGLVGAGMAVLGFKAVAWPVMGRILLAVIAAPSLSFIGGSVTMASLYRLLRRSAPGRVDRIFSRLEILSSAFAAYTHGLMDGQYAVGIITMALVIHSGKADLWHQIPWWVIALSAFSISFGTAMGGWQVVKTLGMKVVDLHPIHGFAAEFAAAAVIETASHLGIPISTTHCISAAIMGVGATKRLSAVRWGVAGNMVAAWMLTFPLCGGLSYIFASLMKVIF